MVWMTLRLLCMPAQMIQTMSFTQIMDIWRPGRSLEDHLKILAYWPTYGLHSRHLGVLFFYLCHIIVGEPNLKKAVESKSVVLHHKMA